MKENLTKESLGQRTFGAGVKLLLLYDPNEKSEVNDQVREFALAFFKAAVQLGILAGNAMVDFIQKSINPLVSNDIFYARPPLLASDENRLLEVYYLAVKNPESEGLREDAIENDILTSLKVAWRNHDAEGKKPLTPRIKRLEEIRGALVLQAPALLKKIQDFHDSSKEVMLCSPEMPTEVLKLLQEDVDNKNLNLIANSMSNFFASTRIPSSPAPATSKKPEKDSDCRII